MPETTRPDPLQQATLEDLVAALGPKGGTQVEVTEDEEPQAEAAQAEDGQAEAALQLDEDGTVGAELTDVLPMDDDDDLSQVEGEASPRLVSIVESLLFAATGPMTVKQLRKILKDPSKEQVQRALKHLRRVTDGRGVVLHQVAGGFRLRTNPENAQFVQRMLSARPIRLSRSQLEALAVVAYRQPVTKAEIDHVRGVDGSAVIKLLLDRDLIKVVGRKEEAGRPLLYGTTVAFLELFNLRSLRDMPDLHEFRELNAESQATLRESLGGEAALHEEQEALGQETMKFEGDEGASESESGSESWSQDESGSESEDESESESESESEPEDGSEPEDESDSESGDEDESASESEDEDEPESESEGESESEREPEPL